MTRAECHLLLLFAAILLGVATYPQSTINSCGTSLPLGFSSHNLQFVRVEGHGIGKPGIYTFYCEPTVREAVRRAGGITTWTLIPPALLHSRVSSANVFISGRNIGAPSIKLTPMSNAERYLLGIPMRLSTATERDLQLIPGIGPSLAKKVIDARRKSGCFTRKTDLKAVTGVSDAKYEQIAPYLTTGS
ncbi:MAG: helix-hairpin-helix domain-containing protein [Pseudomonadota bacterium]